MVERFNFAGHGQIRFLGLDMLYNWGFFTLDVDDEGLHHEGMFHRNLLA
jgi:hypothetical protein